ncbi:hypothetical protein PPEP_a2202 [Pseudoalteromonas peptidolytica F12-50-A1]|uniref:Uncharacterized protein n=1 Tax=Pseudoalteromonas peptidolytica F12-50-A1 TaxID=1315280 RepID=A0A8I0T5S0_9GAMM|nr:hypothetical protein [Pseudoalteromonas peptidolytica F12-50-A1]
MCADPIMVWLVDDRLLSIACIWSITVTKRWESCFLWLVENI